MINTALIEQYNRLRAFTRNQYRPYNPIEQKELKESAPLLKFAMYKDALETERDNINQVKQLCMKTGVTRFIMSTSYFQFFDPDQPAFERVKSHYFDQRNRVRYTDKLVSVVSYWSRFGLYLVDGTKNNGMYELVNDTWVHTRSANKIISSLYDIGYVSVRGRTPVACDPKVFSKIDISESYDLIDFCDSKKFKSPTVEKFIKSTLSNIRRYRWPDQSNLIKQVNKLLGNNVE